MRAQNALEAGGAGGHDAVVGGVVTPVDGGGKIGVCAVSNAVGEGGQQEIGERDRGQGRYGIGPADDGRIPKNEGVKILVVGRQLQVILPIEIPIRRGADIKIEVHGSDIILGGHQKHFNLRGLVGDIIGQGLVHIIGNVEGGIDGGVLGGRVGKSRKPVERLAVQSEPGDEVGIEHSVGNVVSGDRRAEHRRAVHRGDQVGHGVVGVDEGLSIAVGVRQRGNRKKVGGQSAGPVVGNDGDIAGEAGNVGGREGQHGIGGVRHIIGQLDDLIGERPVVGIHQGAVDVG